MDGGIVYSDGHVCRVSFIYCPEVIVMQIKTFFRENRIVVIAFLLPILLIVIVAFSVYLPAFFIKTNYRFVYATCVGGSSYYSPLSCEDYLKQRYSVVNGKLVVNEVTLGKDENFNAHIFIHDTQKNESQEITSSEAKKLTINDLLTSPDGITVSGEYDSNNSGEFFIFGGRSSRFAYYLTKGGSRTKLNLIGNSESYYYQNNFKFIGWKL